MATVSKSPEGTQRVQFSRDGKRHTVYLGDVSQRDAQTTARRVEELLMVRRGLAALSPSTATWLQSCSPGLKSKLAKAGLIDSGGQAVPRLKEWIEQYVAGRVDLSERTLVRLRHCGRLLTSYFGGTKRLDITVAEAEGFIRSLSHPAKRGVKPMDRNTTRRMAGRCKQIWLAAIQAELISKNPFAGIVSTVTPNRSRDFFVELTLYDKLIASCPDTEWMALLALARFGGLRIPSETNALTWGDVDLKAETLKVSNVKTMKATGESFRVLPLFPEVRAALERLTPGKPGDHVIRKHRGENIRTELGRIAKKGGVLLWEKPFQNMRLTRASELMAAGYPAFVACRWMGHSEEVARGFYWRATQEHHEKAVGKKRGSKNPTQNPTHTSSSYDPTLSKPWTWCYENPQENMISRSIKLRVPKDLILPS